MDLSNVTFNSNHKLEAAAKDATMGLRLLALAFFASIAATSLGISVAELDLPGYFAWLSTGLSVAAFVAGAYGSYLAASALDWSGFITGVIVLSMFIPFLRLICMIVLLSFSVSLIKKAGYRVSLFGPLRKRATA
ncbi:MULTISPECIES: hypothetical protein [Lysobacter]|jgi:hypothetical protein|uniref:Transmembrane protein n=1 Tax=Lysobacter gummosus TaxID=262324 RepID=A0ABY3XFG5_9GAMM|nr:MULTISPECIES: hypothetical protein [Lysobacter]ALN89774.1 hypothetical protein LG3211_0792 [Lysobacter gummosus]UJB18337.1 hypothetical protein L1A79_18645 [Lysobacter capsici]UJQ27939.1 hypothetical protein L2D09_21240 [Lysobacter gummosus]UNP30381.1 hypothetical protein MOV92_03635 [Lysobacter gummosus]